jgi:hypothetical protein
MALKDNPDGSAEAKAWSDLEGWHIIGVERFKPGVLRLTCRSIEADLPFHVRLASAPGTQRQRKLIMRQIYIKESLVPWHPSNQRG